MVNSGQSQTVMTYTEFVTPLYFYNKKVGQTEVPRYFNFEMRNQLWNRLHEKWKLIRSNDRKLLIAKNQSPSLMSTLGYMYGSQLPGKWQVHSWDFPVMTVHHQVDREAVQICFVHHMMLLQISQPFLDMQCSNQVSEDIMLCWRNGQKHMEGILPKGPYPPCVSIAGRALLAGYPWYIGG